MTHRQLVLGFLLEFTLVLYSGPLFAQACDELKQESDETLVEFVKKDYDRRLADSGLRLIADMRAEFEDNGLLETELSAIETTYQDKKQAANQANSAHLRAKDAWRESCDGG